MIYYGMDGQRISQAEAMEFYGSRNDERQVARTTVGEARVSTVLLLIDHGFGQGRPLIFETMIFGGAHDDYCERYATKEEALEGHARAVAMVTP